jgi:hypothetical protein
VRESVTAHPTTDWSASGDSPARARSDNSYRLIEHVPHPAGEFMRLFSTASRSLLKGWFMSRARGLGEASDAEGDVQQDLVAAICSASRNEERRIQRSLHRFRESIEFLTDSDGDVNHGGVAERGHPSAYTETQASAVTVIGLSRQALTLTQETDARF